MKKNNIAIVVGVIVIAIIILLLILFGSKKEVTFDSQGGSIVPTQEVGFMKKAKKPENPTKEGYTFDNWYYDEIVYDFDKKVTKDITLKAGWIKDGEQPVAKDGFTVKFDTDGGSSIDSVTVEKNGTLSKPSNPTREGYKFVAWQLDGKDYDFSSKVTKNITLKAKWEKDDTQPSGGEKAPSLSSGNFSLKVGGSKRLSVNNATGKVTWKSSNTRVATVDSNGNVKAIKAGTATITATVDGKSLTVKVTVSNQSQTQPTNPTNPTEKPTEEPTEKPTEKPTDPVKHTASCVKVAESSTDQCRVVIDGGAVSGKVKVTGTNGKSRVVDTGTLMASSLVKSLEIVSVN